MKRPLADNSNQSQDKKKQSYTEWTSQPTSQLCPLQKKCKSIYGLALHENAIHIQYFNKDMSKEMRLNQRINLIPGNNPLPLDQNQNQQLPISNNLQIQPKQKPTVACNGKNKYFFHCMGCTKKYSILTNLKNHQVKEQPEIPFNFEACTPFVMRNDIDDLTEEMKSIKANNLNWEFKIQELEKNK